jgi:ubiquinone/menaquinone biosynthesis C-methylase UbiE
VLRGPPLLLGIGALAVGEQALGQPRPALERPLEAVDLEEVEADHAGDSTRARLTGLSDERDIASYYARGEEQGRLADWGRLEFLRTRALLARFLPPPPATVLDVGGGAGAYALPLAAEGYEVHLLDPTPLHVEQATAASAAQPDAPLVSVRLGDARELPFAGGGADAVLMLGPLYHLTEAADRTRALREAARVLRPGGVLLAAAITRFASTLDGIAQGFLLQPGFEAIVERDLADGQHRNPDGHPGWFTTAYFHRPDELEREVATAGFDVRALLAIEGAVGAAAETRALDDWLDDPAKREVLLRAIARVEAEPSLLGASPHVMAIATRP